MKQVTFDEVQVMVRELLGELFKSTNVSMSLNEKPNEGAIKFEIVIKKPGGETTNA